MHSPLSVAVVIVFVGHVSSSEWTVELSARKCSLARSRSAVALAALWITAKPVKLQNFETVRKASSK